MSKVQSKIMSKLPSKSKLKFVCIIPCRCAWCKKEIKDLPELRIATEKGKDKSVCYECVKLRYLNFETEYKNNPLKNKYHDRIIKRARLELKKIEKELEGYHKCKK